MLSTFSRVTYLLLVTLFSISNVLADDTKTKRPPKSHELDNQVGAVAIGPEATASDSNTAGATASVGAEIVAVHASGQGEGEIGCERNYYSEQCADKWNHPLHAVSAAVHYNTLGFTANGRFTTGFKLNSQIFLGGTTLKNDDYGCSFYYGVGASANTQVSSMRPGDTLFVVNVGPETGFLCETRTGLLFMISPTVGAGYARSMSPGDSNLPAIDSGQNYHTVTAGVRSRLMIKDKLLLQAEGVTTPTLLKSVSNAGTMTTGRADVLILVSEDKDGQAWRLGGYAQGLHIVDGNGPQYNGGEVGFSTLINF